MSTSSPSPPPQPSTNPPPLSARKPQSIPWTHQETVFLIQSYQQKWYSLKRGQLKANQWEQIATLVAARCGYHHSHPSKSPIQCRHKMEKLRRRYRDEKRRLSFSGGFSNWPYFTLMDSLESGQLPISARHLNNSQDNEDDEEGEDEEEEDGGRVKSGSINSVGQMPMMVNRMAEEIRGFAAQMVRVEKRRMEMVRETERWRMEMENKRMEMIMEFNRRMEDMIGAVCEDSELEAPH